ncbi:MAG: winged helix-turn-helix domain-containing protein [Patescibacteria group bacterium]|nr:winged helix-turn-helix domain-containing protein [Patescibacteria group bacterium]MBU1870565.1 winged helix-turn-helix domain-containing protein [Patescibacteria group bacterium]
MLDKLFGSRTRVKILKLFLLHPLNKFYIRQLSRDLKLQLNSVRRELENLKNFGILSSSNNDKEEENDKEGNGQEKKYYRANLEFVLFDEIKALIVKAQILYEKDFVEKLQSIGKVKLLVLSGLFVNNPNSAIDLLLVGKFNKIKLLKLIKELENGLGKEINYTIFDPIEFKYRRDITDVFLYSVLDGKKMIVINEVGLS